jgi:uncharacterized protein with GYD domain
MLQRAQDYAAAGMLASGSKGAESQRNFIEGLGGRVVAQYALNGQYDVLLIVDLPDEETSLAFALQASQDGFYTEVLSAFSPEEVDASVERLEPLLSTGDDDSA